MQKRDSQSIIDLLDEHLRDDDGAGHREFIRNCVDQFEVVGSEADILGVKWREFMYSSLVRELYLESDDFSYEAFSHIYSSLTQTPAWFPLAEDLSALDVYRRVLRDEEFLPLLSEQSLSPDQREQRVDTLRSNGYVLVGMADRCLYFTAFGPSPDGAEQRRIHSNAREYGEQSYMEAAQRLQPLDSSIARASEHLGLYFGEYSQALGGLQQKFFG